MGERCNVSQFLGNRLNLLSKFQDSSRLFCHKPSVEFRQHSRQFCVQADAAPPPLMQWLRTFGIERLYTVRKMYLKLELGQLR